MLANSLLCRICYTAATLNMTREAVVQAGENYRALVDAICSYMRNTGCGVDAAIEAIGKYAL